MQKLSEFKTVADRRNYIARQTNTLLDAIGKTLSTEDANNAHCENMIGAVAIPLGIAGPIALKTEEEVNKNYYLPLATTEGALVASVNRGCKAITQSGGASVYIKKVGTTRGPVFETRSLQESMKVKAWLVEHEQQVAQIAQKTSNHLTYLKMDIHIVGTLIYLRLYFDTDDAMGMNMVTIATKAVCDFIVQNTNATCKSVAGNMDIDKKPAWINSINGRGRSVWADVIVGAATVSQVLKTTPEKIHEVWLAKCMVGSALAGSLGYNCHFANIVAAFFAATGQDLAHTVEGSIGITTTKLVDNGALYISIFAPDIMVGVVGGGTGLSTQKQARELIGAKKPDELTEALAAAILAGELSLLASLAEGSLTNAHMQLGR